MGETWQCESSTEVWRPYLDPRRIHALSTAPALTGGGWFHSQIGRASCRERCNSRWEWNHVEKKPEEQGRGRLGEAARSHRPDDSGDLRDRPQRRLQGRVAG